MSHATWAYLFDEISSGQSLKGCLVKGPISVLRKAQANDELKDITKFQHVNVPSLLGFLERAPETSKQIFDFLSKEFPCLYMFVLAKIGKK